MARYASILLALIITVISCAAAAQQTYAIAGKHQDLEMACEDCHKTAVPAKRAPVSSCYDCHGDYSDVAALTAHMEVNPHMSHQGEIRCTLCHKTHQPSVLSCNECHSFEMTVK